MGDFSVLGGGQSGMTAKPAPGCWCHRPVESQEAETGKRQLLKRSVVIRCGICTIGDVVPHGCDKPHTGTAGELRRLPFRLFSAG